MEAEGLEDGFGVGDEVFKFVVASFGEDVFDEFDLVELVHAEDAAGVPSGGSGFTAETGGVGGELHRELVGFQDFIAVEVGDGDFGGGDEPEVVLGVVEVLGEFREVASADERIGGDKGGGVDLVVAVFLDLEVGHEVDQGALEFGAGAGVDDETGAADFHAAFEVDEGFFFGDFPVGFEVVAGRFFAPGADDDVVLF